MQVQERNHRTFRFMNKNKHDNTEQKGIKNMGGEKKHIYRFEKNHVKTTA